MARTNAMLHDVVAAHTRALIAEQFPKIASSNNHTVRPWYAGKLDYSPPVADLAAQGFALIDGRLDYVEGRTVAALDYLLRQHKITLFIMPVSDTTRASASAVSTRGFQIFAWRDPAFAYTAISDLNASELRQFAAAINQSNRANATASQAPVATP